jgi:hypothetical protein
VFRLNLYPEAEEKRRARLAQAGQTALITFLAAVTLSLTAFHAGSSVILTDRTRDLRRRQAQFDTEAASIRSSGGAAGLGQLQQRLAARASRTVWSPKFVEVARRIPTAIVLDEISVRERGRGQTGPALSVLGSVIPGAARDPSAAILGFVSSLKESPAFMEGLSSIELSSVSTEKETGITSFQIVCPLTDAPAQRPSQDMENPELTRPAPRKGR